MKKNIGFVSLDSCLTEWLLEKLRLSAPDTPAAKELQEGLSELMNGTASSLMVEMGEISPKTFLGDVIHCGALSIDLRLRRGIRDGKEIALTPKEFDILYFLARNRGEVFTKEQIYQAGKMIICWMTATSWHLSENSERRLNQIRMHRSIS